MIGGFGLPHGNPWMSVGSRSRQLSSDRKRPDRGLTTAGKPEAEAGRSYIALLQCTPSEYSWRQCDS